ncbi:MAG: amidase, partial [Sphingomonadales bacterium]|nr:amidase [Sphingomonadales bacterium]
MRTALIGLAMVATPVAAQVPSGPEAIAEVSLADLSSWIGSGRMSSESATRLYLARIAAKDRTGPALRSIVAINPDALAQARAADARAKAKRRLGPLDGVPILVKDNIETLDPMPT